MHKILHCVRNDDNKNNYCSEQRGYFPFVSNKLKPENSILLYHSCPNMNYSITIPLSFEKISSLFLSNRNIHNEKKKVNYDYLSVRFQNHDLVMRRFVNCKLSERVSACFALKRFGINCDDFLRFNNLVNINRERKEIISISRNITHTELIEITDISICREIGKDQTQYNQYLSINVKIPFVSGYIAGMICSRIREFNNRNFK